MGAGPPAHPTPLHRFVPPTTGLIVDMFVVRHPNPDFHGSVVALSTRFEFESGECVTPLRLDKVSLLRLMGFTVDRYIKSTRIAGPAAVVEVEAFEPDTDAVAVTRDEPVELSAAIHADQAAKAKGRK